MKEKTAVQLNFEQLCNLMCHQLRTKVCVSIQYDDLLLESSDVEEIFMYLLRFAEKYQATPFQFEFNQVHKDLIWAYIEGSFNKLETLYSQSTFKHTLESARQSYILACRILHFVQKFLVASEINWLDKFLDSTFEIVLKEYLYQLAITLIQAHQIKFKLSHDLLAINFPEVEIQEFQHLVDHPHIFSAICKLFSDQLPVFDVLNLPYYISSLECVQTKIQLATLDQVYDLQACKASYLHLKTTLAKVSLSAADIGFSAHVDSILSV